MHHKYMNTIYVDGIFRDGFKKDLSSRKMIICIIDDIVINHSEVRGVLRRGGSIDIATLISVLEGMSYAFKMNYKDILIKINNQVVEHWIKNNVIKNKINDREFVEDILNKISRLKSWFNEFEIQVIPRNLNKASIELDKKTKGKTFV